LRRSRAFLPPNARPAAINSVAPPSIGIGQGGLKGLLGSPQGGVIGGGGATCPIATEVPAQRKEIKKTFFSRVRFMHSIIELQNNIKFPELNRFSSETYFQTINKVKNKIYKRF
jgi:hypothetical protein